MTSENKSPRDYKDIRQTYSDDDVNYQVLKTEKQGITYRDQRGGLRVENGVWTNEYLREQYLRETGLLIGKMDGRVDLNVIQGDIIDDRVEDGDHRPDTVIWLDKSARPVSWFTDAFWDQIARDGSKKPENDFLNIDRVNWFVQLGYDQLTASRRLGRDDFKIEDVNPDSITALRAYFTVGKLTEENWREEAWKLPTRLDGQHILVVDEVKNRGGTLLIATEVLRKAIPEATVDGTYFWHGGRLSIDGMSADFDNQQMESAPLWYDNNDPMGREVGDISIGYYERLYKKEPTQENLRKKIAAFALSAPHHNPLTDEKRDDLSAKKLKQDIAYATYALAAKKMVHVPSPEFGAEELFKVMESQGLSREEAKTFIQNRQSENRDQARNPRRVA